MQVANCTTPANYFHILRRQLKREIRKPLILMTPKIAAAPQARGVAARRDRARTRRSTACCGTMRRRCQDEKIKLVADDKIRRVVLCSGKVYYDLSRSARSAASTTSICCASSSSIRSRTKALVTELVALQAGRDRLVPGRAAQHGRLVLRRAPIIEWVLNQIGAKHRRPRYAGRPASAATATGLMSKHQAQLKAFLDEALG